MFDNTKKNIPHYFQLDAMDCGPTCLRMIARYYGKNYSLQTLRERSFITREGVSMPGISDAAESIGFRTSGVRITLKQLEEDVPLPCILHWNQNHFVVCYDIRKKRKGYRFHIADPASQNVTYTEEEMKRCWLVTRTEGEEKGTALALEPAPGFYEQEDEKEKDGRNSLSFFFKYLLPYKRQIAHLLLGMLAVSLLQLIFPFAIIGGCRDSGREPGLYHADSDSPARRLRFPAFRGVHTELDIAAHEHAHQHITHLRLPDKADEAAAALLRHQDDRGHHAAHRRP